MKNFINQIRTSDCGFTCLKILLAIINKNNSYLYLDDSNLDNCTFLDLIKKSSDYHIKLEGVNCKDFRLLETPFIAHLIINKTSHFVVVKKIIKRKIITLDPGFKQLKYTYQDFLKVFQGNALIIKEHHELELNSMRTPSIRLNLGLRLLGTVSLLLALSFINQNAQFFLSLGFFAICAIIALASHLNLLNIMKKFDLIFPLDEKNLSVVSEFKTKYFSRRLKMFNAFTICAITSVLLIYNEFSLTIIVGFITLCVIVDRVIRNKYLNARYIKMQLSGQKATHSELLNLSYKMANVNTFFRAIVYFVTICFLLLQMEVLKVVSLNYFIFYYGAIIFIYENLNTATNEFMGRFEERSLLCRIKNLTN